MQFVVNPLKYLHKLDWAVTVQAAEFANESETVTRIIIVPEIFQAVAVIAPVEGFGLGLAIAQGLTGLLNGKINVQSEFGKGSLFTVMVPLPITEEHHLTQEVALSCNLPNGLRILAIDDNAVLLYEDMRYANPLPGTVRYLPER
jgi:hypothetical protein